MIRFYFQKIFFLFLFFSGRTFSQNISINTTGAANTTNSTLEILGIGTATNGSGLYVSQSAAVTNAIYGFRLYNTSTSSTTTINKYGLDIQSTGGWTGTSSNNIGLQVNATGGTNNYAIIVPSGGGNVGIGTSTPAQLFEVANNNTIKIGDAYLSSGGTTYAHLATYAWYNGSAWQFPGATAGALLQLAGQATNFYTHNGAGTFTSTMNINSSGTVGIGTSSQFQVNNSGNIIKINNVTTSFPSSQGTASTVLMNNGSGTLTWSQVSSGNNIMFAGFQVFTSNNAAWTPPSGVSKVMIEVWGGGGGGGGSTCCGTGYNGGGGGAGGYGKSLFSVSGNLAITIGGSGSGSAAGANNGSAGGTTTVSGMTSGGGSISAAGGAGGTGANSGYVTAAGGAGPTTSSSLLGIKGYPGNPGLGGGTGGMGGDSPLGGAGGTIGAGVGGTGQVPGGGGAGADNAGSNQPGGAGGAGMVIIWW